jgi:FkbM family methyltransferase
MFKILKNIIKSSIQALGFDIRRLTPDSNPFLQIRKGMEQFDIDLVFDIGANTGQFASELRLIGYKGRMVSFEPLSVAHRELMQKPNRDSQWQIHPRTAIGDFDGEIEINIAGNSVSSSVLPMLESHAAAAVDSVYLAKEKVPIYRLDSIASNYLTGKENLLIKIDTQGFEWQVLDGAKETLQFARGVLCELSLVPLYEGGKLWLEMIERLNSEGFTLWAIQKGFTDPRDGRTLQVDAIFFRLDEK